MEDLECFYFRLICSLVVTKRVIADFHFIIKAKIEHINFYFLILILVSNSVTKYYIIWITIVLILTSTFLILLVDIIFFFKRRINSLTWEIFDIIRFLKKNFCAFISLWPISTGLTSPLGTELRDHKITSISLKNSKGKY